ncbi:Arylsulfatase [Anaerohalosphaera lusitana]|uniref:Arylsulfatase n=1 Tax=Anaerohalosphaera lusitana TaxID=1936003 RepID=A0A1U9NPG3_9BACT|nr:arylsulfatase [Anaerohalosphaera lusitana]AQT69799.1 Arylsulfatase [Anaerohalosphaera lusitana]
MNRRTFLKNCALTVGAASFSGCAGMTGPSDKPSSASDRPNIVYILADDLGYGDVSCMNKDSKIHTTNMDRLAAEGMIFTDAHAGAAVCTPTRYGILTGRYCWRSRLKKGGIWGDSPPVIEKDRMTVASMLKPYGYHSACIGKWHLGWHWQMKDDNPEQIDFTKPIQQGPTTNGFDYSFCLPASLDIPPYVYVENDKVTAPPNRVVEGKTGKLLMREGPTGADFVHKDVLPDLTEKAVTYIDQRSESNKPFFLYFALPAPHTPILPTEQFRGKSGTNEYGDFVLQVDHTVGQVMRALKRNGLKENTLFIFTSDNGCAPHVNFEELAEYGHDPSYLFRGHKADIYEGGHRMPFIARWPKRVKAKTRCSDTTCLTDLMATAADINGIDLPDSAAEDSVSMLPNLLRTATGPLREATVHQSVNGSFSIRQGKWKLILCPGSGGWSPPRPGSPKIKDLPPVQLYDLSSDIDENENLHAQHPEIVRRLTNLLQSYIDRGRSTPGQPQKNNGKVPIRP